MKVVQLYNNSYQEFLDIIVDVKCDFLGDERMAAWLLTRDGQLTAQP